MAHFKLDEFISFYNLNKKSGKEPFNRLSFGQMLFPDKTDGAIHSLLSKWSNPAESNVPSFSCYIKISKQTEIPMEVIKKYHKD